MLAIGASFGCVFRKERICFVDLFIQGISYMLRASQVAPVVKKKKTHLPT